MTADDEEQVPLLHSEQVRVRAPFPWFQFSILFALQTAGYLTLRSTSPFIPDLIRNIGIARGEKNVGYYVGFQTSTIYAAETATAFYCCWLSDYTGRKPVFLASIIGLALCMCGFGLLKTFFALLFCMLAEMVDPADIARAFAYSDLAWYVAGTIGAKIGGSLSRPVEQFPGLFGSSEFFKEYPYFLPCAVCSFLLFVAWLVGTVFLKETLVKPFQKKTQESEPIASMEEGDESTERPSSLAPGIIIIAINLAAICLVEKFYWATEALFLSTPIKDGGLGLSPRAIGTFSSFSSILIGTSQLFIFPRMHDKWGSGYVFILGASASLPRFVLWPVMNWIARRDGNPNSVLVLFALGSQSCCSALVQFGCSALFLVSGLQYSNASYQSVASVMRAIAPALSNSLFSLSIDKGYLGGYLVYFVFVCSSVIALCAASFLPRVKKTRKSIV
ncbi:member of major facilitator superfamily multidrug-resistance, DHA1 sub-family [Amanita rubescens]|nr:member of major facilitator superfamily multidrug-resistance, DHA1 sub-family [Amanita rubescens]